MTGDGILIDAGYNIAGVEVRKGRIRDVLVSSSNDNARKATAMTFQFGTIVIFMPFGYSMPAPKLLAFNGLARTGTPQLISENFILTIRLGGGRSSNTSNISSNKGTGTAALDPTDGISLTIGGIINPAAGSTAVYTLRTTFSDSSRVIDEATVSGLGVSAGMFLTCSVSGTAARAGQPNIVSLAFSTTGFVPDNARILLGVPNGLGLSMPLTTRVFNSVCCYVTFCNIPCNITVKSISGNAIMMELPGTGATNLPDEANISVTLNNILNLWSGNKVCRAAAVPRSFGISIFCFSTMSN
jgi:hypothetical protein